MTGTSFITSGITVASEISVGSRALGWCLLPTLAVFILQFPSTDSGLLVVAPMNEVAMVGSRVRMVCSRYSSSDRAVDWEFAPAVSDNFSYIFTDLEIVKNQSLRYKIDADYSRRYDIVIDSVDSSYAGTYICTPGPVIEGAVIEGASNSTSESVETSGSAQLIVLASDPVCGTNASASNGSVVEGDYIEMWCTVNYTGNWIPVMDWNSTIMGQHISYTFETAAGSSSITMQLSSANDGVALACKTSFNSQNYKNVRSPRPTEVPSVNVPDYQYVWTFIPRVLYGPRNLTITAKRIVYAVGDRLVCWAKGNPSPAYEWREIETNRTTKGSVLTIEGYLMTDKIHNFRCTAYNMVAGTRREIAETITFQVIAASNAVSTVLTAAVLVAEITLGLAVALLVSH